METAMMGLAISLEVETRYDVLYRWSALPPAVKPVCGLGVAFRYWICGGWKGDGFFCHGRVATSTVDPHEDRELILFACTRWPDDIER
jgi:hypothetical protein